MPDRRGIFGLALVDYFSILLFVLIVIFFFIMLGSAAKVQREEDVRAKALGVESQLALLNFLRSTGPDNLTIAELVSHQDRAEDFKKAANAVFKDLAERKGLFRWWIRLYAPHELPQLRYVSDLSGLDYDVGDVCDPRNPWSAVATVTLPLHSPEPRAAKVVLCLSP